MRSTMCPHCGQRGEATPSRTTVSSFGKKKRLPRVVRRLLVCAIAGTGAAMTLALANWIRPATHQVAEEVAVECDEIRANGEEESGELRACERKLSSLRAHARLASGQ